MKKILQSLILGLAIFSIHIVLGFFFVWLTNSQYGGYYGIIGGLVFYFIIAFWIYWLLSYIYIYITKNDKYRNTKYLKAAVIVGIGYFASRIPDIIDGYFLEHFKWQGFLVFILFVPLLVETETFLRRRMTKSA